MQTNKPWQRLIGLLIALVVFSSPLLAQQRRGSARPRKPPTAEPSEPVPTFDSLLAADSYKVYCELRGVGGLIRSPAVTDLLDPFTKLAGPPKEFKTAVKWLHAHADVLAGSRMMVAAWPSIPTLPTVVIAVEFSSTEEAKKFYPELRDFIPTLLPTPTPTPVPTPTATPVPAPTEALTPQPAPVGSPRATDSRAIVAEPILVPVNTSQNTVAPGQRATEPSLPPYHMQQIGSLVLISDRAFKPKDLRPRGSKPLEEDQNFILARNRFASESLFLFVDLKSIEKEEKEQRKKWQEEAQKRSEAEAANPPTMDEAIAVEPQPPAPPPDEQSPAPIEESRAVVMEPTPVSTPTDSEGTSSATLSSTPRGTDELSPMFFSLYSLLFGGENKWPEAVGAALVFEGDAYIIRTLIINSTENKGTALPFFPQFASGPAIVPESPNIFPADTDFFASVSIDYPQIYEGMLKANANLAKLAAESQRNVGLVLNEAPPPEAPFAALEKKLGLTIKDDLLPLLGNEVAVALPRKATKALREQIKDQSGKQPADGTAEVTSPKVAEPIPVFAISVKDREAVRRLIPKLVEGMGFKGANLFSQSEKRDGTELISYGGLFSYAFVDNFLVVSPDASETRRVVDAYLSHQTLSSDGHFRNFTRWQPRQVLGQIYIGAELMEAYNPFGLVIGGSVNSRMNDFTSRLSPLIEPTTYALSNDGSGPLHELHIPKNLLLWMVGASMLGFQTTADQTNEFAVKNLLRTIHSAEETFEATTGKGRYGTIDELMAENLIDKESIEKYGYRIEVTPSGDKFAATAVPIEYGVSGTLSFFIDETGELRGGDHAGGPATAADQPVY